MLSPKNILWSVSFRYSTLFMSKLEWPMYFIRLSAYHVIYRRYSQTNFICRRWACFWNRAKNFIQEWTLKTLSSWWSRDWLVTPRKIKKPKVYSFLTYFPIKSLPFYRSASWKLEIPFLHVKIFFYSSLFYKSYLHYYSGKIFVLDLTFEHSLIMHQRKIISRRKAFEYATFMREK